MTKTKIKLTGKQELFCLAYTGEARFNATEAARIAGYEGDDHSLRSVGHENLTKLDIKNRIKELTEQRFKDAGYQVDRVIKEIMDIAFVDIEDFVKWDIDGNPQVKFDPGEQSTNAISELSTHRMVGKEKDVTAHVTKIKLHDKKWALEMLSKLLGMDSGKEINDININLKFNVKSKRN